MEIVKNESVEKKYSQRHASLHKRMPSGISISCLHYVTTQHKEFAAKLKYINIKLCCRYLGANFKLITLCFHLTDF